MKWSLRILNEYLTDARQRYEYVQIKVEEAYDELIHYENILSYTTWFNRQVLELCRDKIKEDTTIQENSKEQFLKIINNRISICDNRF